ncbi:MAG: PAC2 family protein [Candidatus Bathyarchaeota archaeon]|nr:PAC2 family protein [Candidatus Bathyarchaeota archaeon]MDW8040119.1 PAC2 family protein [Nitrososphaerota archaeon]
MPLTIQIEEKPKLDNPVLIEGLPGIGFVANIVALHLIHELEAKRFARIFSASFQDLAATTETGEPRSPINELYYYRSMDESHDLIIWYGNTQALTTVGQYELCGRILDVAEELGCGFLITVGGFKQEEVKETPEIYCAASDGETLKEALNLGAKIMVGNIFGVAGILIGLGALRGFKGFSILVETPGTCPDAKAARHALSVLNKYLGLKVDLSRLDLAAEKTAKILESFGWVRAVKEEEKKREELRWFV